MHVRHTWCGVLGLVTIFGCAISPAARDTVPYGTPHAGYLLGGTAIPERGAGYVRLRPQSAQRYGTKSLVEAVKRAAASVADALPGGEALRVGDLSSWRGGPQARHVSHRTGRDADLFFYRLSQDSRVAPLGHPLVFDRYGLAMRSRGVVRFDDARNWHLVRSLLLDPQARVQWLFCSNDIKARLLRYASQVEPSSRALARAAWVLHQPPNVDAHADHFHVRVACSDREKALGCIDGAPQWSWLYDIGGKLDPASRASLTDERLTALLFDRTSRQ